MKFDFPFTAPIFAFSDPPSVLTYPHVEDDGVLCLLTSSSSFTPYNPVAVVSKLLEESKELIGKSVTGENREDFRSEFLSYWNRSGLDSLKFISLVEPIGPSRKIWVWRGTIYDVLGGDKLSLDSWLRHFYGDRSFELVPAGLVCLSTPMFPEEYPRTTGDVVKVIKTWGDKEGNKLLQALATLAPQEIPLLLASSSGNGVCYAGIKLLRPRKSDSKFAQTGDPLTKGFRGLEHVPRGTLVSRYLSFPQSVTRHAVERADHKWIHGRDFDFGQFDLCMKNKVILGCGPIGSSLAKTLAACRIGKIILVDPEDLTWANVGRHYLGAKYVGVNKAKSLAEDLQANYPHLKFEYRRGRWEEIAESEPDLVLKADLMIITVGSWSC